MATSANRIAEYFRPQWTQTIAGRTALSASVHALALLLMANWWWIAAHKLHPAGLASGTRLVLHYKPGKLAEPSQEDHRIVQRHHAAPRRTTPTPFAAPMVTAAASATMDAPNLQGEAGDDAHGDGSASLRYVQAFPDQRPDFSAQGATGDVVIDVQIDDTGRVQRVFARKSMGSAIDAMVIATVQRWMFDPARKDGRAVPSVQELHFHYDRSWSKGSCGWDCIGLMSQ
jgi:protein TonB